MLLPSFGLAFAIAGVAFALAGSSMAIRRAVSSRIPFGFAPTTTTGIQKIKHVVIIMQENRSFDQYFGSFPGADGIPAGVCVPDPKNGGCVKPFHDPND